LNPFQGLKLIDRGLYSSIDYRRNHLESLSGIETGKTSIEFSLATRRNHLESLSGIETRRCQRQTQRTMNAEITLNPFQGLKHLRLKQI